MRSSDPDIEERKQAMAEPMPPPPMMMVCLLMFLFLFLSAKSLDGVFDAHPDLRMAAQHLAPRLAQRQDAARLGVARLAIAHGSDGGLLDVLRGVEVRLSLRQRDHIQALPAQRRCACRHLHGLCRSDHAETICNESHARL